MAKLKTRVEEQIGETVSRYESYMSKLKDEHTKSSALNSRNISTLARILKRAR